MRANVLLKVLKTLLFITPCLYKSNYNYKKKCYVNAEQKGNNILNLLLAFLLFFEGTFLFTFYCKLYPRLFLYICFKMRDLLTTM